MNTPNGKPPIELPESLAAQLREFEQRLRSLETVATVAGGLCGLFLTYSVLFLSDRIWDTPVWARAVLFLAGFLGLGWFAGRWLRHWWWRRRNVRELAILVQKQYGNMGDRLLGAVELANGGDLPENISPALCRAAIRQVAEETQKYDFKAAVPRREPRNYSIILFVLLGAVATAFILFPDAGLNAVRRWLQPLSGVERYTFVRIEDLPAEQVVPHGEPFEIACRLSRLSAWHPPSAVCRFENQPILEAAVSGGLAVFKIPRQTAPGMLTLSIGDVSRKIKIIPVYRPELAELTATLSLPDYLQRTNQAVKIENGMLELLEGSRAQLSGKINRNIKSASLTAAGKERSLAIQGRSFVTEPFTPKDVEKGLLAWTDCFGLSAPQPYTLNIARVEDEPPSVECRGISHAVAVLEDELVTLEARADDDFGLRELWIVWSASSGKDKKNPDQTGNETLARGSPEAMTLAGTYTFSPIAAHIPEETLVTLYASALDYFPGRKPVLSPAYRIYVLSRAHHAKLLSEQMDAVRTQIEDLARDEERLLDENTDLSKQPKDKMASEKTASSLKENAQSEDRHSSRLDDIADKAKDLIKEGMRNKDIPEDTLRKWAELAQSMEDLAGREMKDAAGNLQKAASSGGEQRPSDLAKAMDLEKKILESLRQSEKKLNASLEEMAAKNFVNRLMALSSQEKRISTTLRDLMPKIVGVSAADLPTETARELTGLTTSQDSARTEASNVQDDLAGFFNRTRTPIYDTVYQDMKASNTVDRLTTLTGLIKNNIAGQATQESDAWSFQFQAWAEMLKKKLDEGGQKDGESKSLEESDMELLISLMRARQREESLREQTRLVEKAKPSSKTYPADSRKLADLQGELARDIRPLERKARMEDLRRLIEKVGGEMMNAGMFLRRPQTDSETIAIETEIIELLSAGMESCSGKSGSAAQKLAMAMGMGKKGMGAGRTGGGSTAGGATDKANVDGGGNASGTDADKRDVEKTGGLNPEDVSEEFKELVESYFNSLEKNK